MAAGSSGKSEKGNFDAKETIATANSTQLTPVEESPRVHAFGRQEVNSSEFCRASN